MFPQSTRRSLPMALLRARESVMSHFRPMLAAHNVTEQQWRVLRVVDEEGPLDATEVANRASVLAPSLTRIIKTLEDRGFILRRRADDDGRRAVLSVTESGKAFIEAISPEQRRIYQSLEEKYGVERIEKLLDLLEEFVEE
ncbi:homoprotocatechuate degradation regulator HpaR [Maritalea mobilis]|uniref:Homoprotocatechuate degradation regulator HpaR n=1 Tax=Maritalea mobilis TaxID=483324 RepID=A0A4R6VGB1_9HYPH|nr:homoprotocatechuate degradation operon regulator HpaR [Maritalea mobilis]TDQ62054.1 homoprotocatechuate degradation regulator HpaR [Maritalea mobilis]